MARLVQLQPIDPRATAGPRATFGEAAGAMFEREQMVGELGSRNRFLNEVYDPFIGYFNSTIRPMAPDLFSYGIENSARAPNNSPISLETFQAIQDQGFHPDEETLTRFIEELDAAGVAYPDEIAPTAFFERRERMEQELLSQVERRDEVLMRARGASGVFGQLVGGFGAGFDNIESVVTMPIGAASRAGILATALIEGGINAATEAATTPTRNAFLRELGLPDESILENAAFGFAVGGALGGGLRSITRLGEVLRDRREALIEVAEASGDPEAQVIAQQLRRDLEDEEAATDGGDGPEVREHLERAQTAAQAAHEGGLPDMPDRPTFSQPRASILNGEIEEVDPRELLVQPDVFQFKSDIVAEGGVTSKLVNVTEWAPERAGIVLVYEYADGTRAIADGHQRTALANRIMAQSDQQITMAAKVFREIDGFSPEEIRGLAAVKNIAEAADGMTTAMARDAARVLRVRPEAITQLPAGPGIARAQSLARLSDEAFDMFINEVVPERFAELVGRMVDDTQMHAAMMQLLKRTGPDTTAQAESILAQALQAPVSREVTADLFGEQEIVESLYLERAKVLERAMRIMRDDRNVFRTLDERAERIQGTGANRLDTATNKHTRQQVEQALAAVRKLAHRAGPISEALNDGAKAYKGSGRLKEAAQRVADAVRREVERNGLAGAGAGAPGRNAKPARAGATAPDPLEGFADPVGGDGVRAQIDGTRGELAPSGDDLADMVPVARGFDDEGNEIAVVKSRADLAAELDADDEAVAVLDICVKG